MPAWAADGLLVLLRWLHTLAAIGLLGWLLVYLVEGTTGPGAARRFKEVVEITLLVLLATGAVLAFDRLSQGAGTLYALVLGGKVLLAVLTYQFAFRWRHTGLAPSSRDGRLALALGAGTVLLAAVLKGVFESGLRGEP